MPGSATGRHGGHGGVRKRPGLNPLFLTPCAGRWTGVASEGQGGVAGLLAELSGHLLAVQEILSRPEIQRLAAYRERHRGCGEAYTWVRNRSGSRYWYWYLKCPGRRPSSVYLGSSPEAHRALMEAAGILARARRALAKLSLGELAAQLAEAARKLEKLEAAAPGGHGEPAPGREAAASEPNTTPAQPPQPARKTRRENNKQKTGTTRTPPAQPPGNPERARPPAAQKGRERRERRTEPPRRGAPQEPRTHGKHS